MRRDHTQVGFVPIVVGSTAVEVRCRSSTFGSRQMLRNWVNCPRTYLAWLCRAWNTPRWPVGASSAPPAVNVVDRVLSF